MACYLPVYTSPALLPNRRNTQYRAPLSKVTPGVGTWRNAAPASQRQRCLAYPVKIIAFFPRFLVWWNGCHWSLGREGLHGGGRSHHIHCGLPVSLGGKNSHDLQYNLGIGWVFYEKILGKRGVKRIGHFFYLVFYFEFSPPAVG